MYNSRLKEARLRSGLTQEDVAKRIGVFKTTISGYETGRSEPCMAHLITMMDIYGVDANWIFQEEMERANKKQILSLSPSESELLALYRRLNEQGQGYVMTTARMASENPEMQKSDTASETA